MVTWGVALALITVSALASSGSVNYCGSKMCGNTNAHTFCQFPEGPSSECLGYIPAQLTLEEKARVITRLNRRRNEAAAGRLRGLPSAGNMLKLRWVEELAREAQRWADQCSPSQTPEEHDVCRDLYSIPVGQSVASVVGEAPGLRVESMVDMWYMQSILYKGNVTYYMPPERNGRHYDDFGQMMWSRTYMVGCGRSRFMAMWHGRLRSIERLVCNFAPRGPVPGRPLWAPALPNTACPPRAVPDERFTALCNFQELAQEVVFTEASMTLKEHLLLNTILEIENNKTLDYLGSLDEIYLTRLAIATIEHTITTEKHFNSMQRRDVVDVAEMEDMKNMLNNVTTNVPVQDLDKSAETTDVTEEFKLVSKKISLVGRPKSYRIEELTDLDNKVENQDTLTEDVAKRVKDFYAEYDFFESEDSTVQQELMNSSTESHYHGHDNTDAVQAVSDKSNNTNKDVINGTGAQLTIVLSNNTLDNVLKDNVTQHVDNRSSYLSDKNIDDYLSDPETVRQLQEALDRMEHTIAAQQTTEKPIKVRREIRNPEEVDLLRDPERYNFELERNKSLERGPMLNMVLKYMPYLKHYENGLLGANRAYSMPSHSFLVLFVIIIV